MSVVCTGLSATALCLYRAPRRRRLCELALALRLETTWYLLITVLCSHVWWAKLGGNCRNGNADLPLFCSPCNFVLRLFLIRNAAIGCCVGSLFTLAACCSELRVKPVAVAHDKCDKQIKMKMLNLGKHHTLLSTISRLP